MFTLIGYGAAALAALLLTIWVLGLRNVVSTNDVHIVQSAKRTTSYGKGEPKNVYYKWPTWMPLIGVRTIALPVSIFSVKLDGYAAYDKGRVPFLVDVMAFFRIAESNSAAQRVATFEQLVAQLHGVLQGACRTILASSEIEAILEGRSEFGKKFTDEVDHNLREWGVQSVKQIELMDIRDGQGSEVIQNIMAKKKSLIEMESRVAVANNDRLAETAEIEAKREVNLRQQEAAQTVGIRTAEVEREVGISKQVAQQSIKEQERETAQRHMAVVQVQQVRQAEINRDVEVVNADRQKRVAIVQAEGVKQQTVTLAEGNLAQAQLNAKAIEAEGNAKGVAETAILMAPVTTQLALAKEIGENEGYQRYLVDVRSIEANQAVGTANAAALEKAQIKVIANTGTATEGISSMGDLFSSVGGTKVAAMMEGLANASDAGRAAVERIAGRGKAA